MIRHIVAGGCSFTASGIGGVPPSDKHPTGGCSFVEDSSYQTAIPQSWVDMVAQTLKVSSLVNTASASHGNIQVANNIMTILQKYKYNTKDTMILFNVSAPTRFDIPCDQHCADKSDHCDTPIDVLDFKYFSRTTDFFKSLEKNMGYDQVELVTSNTLLGMMCFLKQNNFEFKFMTMRDYTQHWTLSKILDRFSSNWIDLDPGHGMAEYVEMLGLKKAPDDYHPSLEGHKKLAQCVLNCL